jgi:hypothetical protein
MLRTPGGGLLAFARLLRRHHPVWRQFLADFGVLVSVSQSPRASNKQVDCFKRGIRTCFRKLFHLPSTSLAYPSLHLPLSR